MHLIEVRTSMQVIFEVRTSISCFLMLNREKVLWQRMEE
jgi:hypothetical protein